MSRQPIATVFGGTRIGNRELFTPENGLEKFFAILAAHNVTTIDTAQSYGNSQSTIGQVKAGDRFVIDTKWSPLWDQPTTAWATKDQIINSAKDSVQKLRVNQVDIFYLHRPDPNTPISETLFAVNEVYMCGVFRRFGLSGFPASEVEAIYNYCVEKGYPLPMVYQGSYNPLNRYKDTVLLPTLRKLGMSFYAYGPSAGGFLGKTVAQVEEIAGNIALVSATCRPYVSNPKFLEALAKWNAVADSEGVSGAELAYRWVAYHSALNRDNGDALIIGASSPKQLEETLNGIEKGPLSDKACAGVHDVWESIKGES
ncbi:putative aldehyde reductase [Bisporella sp. PMI_857]|nr:putative aldehyde reductase [Bisporella sp. PMI_857]